MAEAKKASDFRSCKKGPFELIGVEFPTEEELAEIGKARLHVKTFGLGWLWDRDVLIAQQQSSHGDINRKIGLLDLDGTFTVLYETMESVTSVFHLKSYPNYILFCADENGDENRRLMALNINTKEVAPLTEKCRCSSAKASETHLYWLSTSRTEGKAFDICTAPLQEFFPDGNPTIVKDAQVLFQGTPGVFLSIAEPSPDGTKVVWKQTPGPKGHRLWLSYNNEEPKCIVGEGKELTISSMDVFDDSVYYSSNECSDFKCLSRFCLVNNDVERLTYDGQQESDTAVLIKWDVSLIANSNRGRKIIKVAAGGFSELYELTDGDELKRIQAPENGVFSCSMWSHSEKYYAMNLSAHNVCSDIYVLDFESKTWSQITKNSCNINTDNSAGVELIEFDSFDDKKIPAFHYNPGVKGPCIISIHGGPAAQFVPSFLRSTHMDAHYYLENGIHIIGPNVRGSSGYGSEYMALDDKMLREDSVKDIGALLKWCASQPLIDENRIAVCGGSYGGFMVLASLCAFPEQIRCGVSNVGICNWVTFLENTPEFRRDHRRKEYGDERIPEMREYLLKISPFTNRENIKCPLLLGHGNTDSRVPAAETRMIMKAVQEKRNSCWAMFSDQDGHGFRKPDSKNLWVTLNRKFLMENLASETSMPSPSL